MHLKIASRSSDLARWQAYEVEKHLKKIDPSLQTEMIFKSSFGDRNLEMPLHQMESRGVFTEDFYQDLLDGKFDLVVHSWKDLPIEERKGTTIIATLPRADVRDVLLVPKEIWQKAKKNGKLKILTSSPRRIYNLTPHLKDLLPKWDGERKVEIEFVPVRGNIPSRIGKMWDQDAALILAKAALDRMLTATTGFEEVAQTLQEKIKRCHFMVLPLSINPTAPAQGALAIEISDQREDLKKLFQNLNHQDTFENALQERTILKSYGGGCHQKIGMSILTKTSGTYSILKGLTDSGQVLNQLTFKDHTRAWPKPESLEQMFPLKPSDNSWFSRSALPVSEADLKGKAVLVARAVATEGESGSGKALQTAAQIWTPGLNTWKTLSALGYWVNGCFEGFGEEEHQHVGALAAGVKWVKLTHKGSDYYSKLLPVVAGYQLVSKTLDYSPFLEGKKYFYWMSASSFDRARELFPNEIAKGYHACGPGITLRHLQRSGIPEGRVKVFLDLNAFLKELRPS